VQSAVYSAGRRAVLRAWNWVEHLAVSKVVRWVDQKAE
jgi:hypothetical protein